MNELTEYQQAKQWRKRLGLTRRALADLTGFSAGSIATFELGRQSNGQPIDPSAFRRYKLACACIQAGLDFDWRTVTFDVVEKRKVAI